MKITDETSNVVLAKDAKFGFVYKWGSSSNIMRFLPCRLHEHGLENFPEEYNRVKGGISFIRLEDGMGSLVLKPDTMVDYVGEPHIKIV